MLEELDVFAADIVAYAFSKGATAGQVIAALGYGKDMVIMTSLTQGLQHQGDKSEHGMGDGDSAEA